MLLKQINKAYWVIGLLLYLFFASKNMETREQIYIYLTSFVSFLIFGFVFSGSLGKSVNFFTGKNLAFIVFTTSTILVLIYSLLSYSIAGDLFLFSKVDAMLYYTESMKIKEMSFSEGFEYISRNWGFDDWGAFLWVSMVFRFFPSLIFLKLIHIIVGVFTSVLLFHIGRYLMPRRYAYLGALAFSIASFFAVLHTLVLKETFLIFIITISFYLFYKFSRSRNIFHLIMAFLFSVLVAFFRLPVAMLLIFSFAVTLLLTYFRGITVIILSIVFSALVLSSSFFAMSYDRYLRGGDTELILERKEELAKGGGIVNHVVDPLSAFIGPFPSVVIKMKSNTSLNASGLLYRVLLAAPFFLGVYYVFRYKQKKLYPLVLFFITNAIGVAVSVKGLEIRLTSPHLAMAYITAFWWLSQYDYRRLRLKLSPNLIYGWFIVVIALSFIWNLR